MALGPIATLELPVEETLRALEPMAMLLIPTFNVAVELPTYALGPIAILLTIGATANSVPY